MKIESLKEFVRVARMGGLNAASEKLYISPSTLSEHIAGIEKELGVKLFERTAGNSLKLSEQGLIFLGEIQSILDAYDATVAKCRSMQSQLPLKLGADQFTPELAHPLLSIDSFEIKLIDSALEEGYEKALDSNAIDVAFVPCSSGAIKTALLDSHNHFAFEQVGAMNLSFAMMSDHPLAQRESLCVKDIEPYAVFLNKTLLYPDWVNIINEALSPRMPLRGHLMLDYSSLIDISARGIGTDLYFGFSGGDIQRLGQFSNITIVNELDGHPIRIPLHAIYRKDKRDWRFEKIIDRLRSMDIAL